MRVVVAGLLSAAAAAGLGALWLVGAPLPEPGPAAAPSSPRRASAGPVPAPASRFESPIDLYSTIHADGRAGLVVQIVWHVRSGRVELRSESQSIVPPREPGQLGGGLQALNAFLGPRRQSDVTLECCDALPVQLLVTVLDVLAGAGVQRVSLALGAPSNCVREPVAVATAEIPLPEPAEFGGRVPVPASVLRRATALAPTDREFAHRVFAVQQHRVFELAPGVPPLDIGLHAAQMRVGGVEPQADDSGPFRVGCVLLDGTTARQVWTFLEGMGARGAAVRLLVEPGRE